MTLLTDFLKQAKKGKSVVAVHLMNGHQIKGNVQAYDTTGLVIDHDGHRQYIRQEAISTFYTENGHHPKSNGNDQNPLVSATAEKLQKILSKKHRQKKRSKKGL